MERLLNGSTVYIKRAGEYIPAVIISSIARPCGIVHYLTDTGDAFSSGMIGTAVRATPPGQKK